MELDPIPTDKTSHRDHWWGNIRTALDLLAEQIGTGSFSSLQLSAFTTLLDLWTNRAHGKPPQPLADSEGNAMAPLYVRLDASMESKLADAVATHRADGSRA